MTLSHRGDRHLRRLVKAFIGESDGTVLYGLDGPTGAYTALDLIAKYSRAWRSRAGS